VIALLVRVGREDMGGRHPRRWTPEEYRDGVDFAASRWLVAEQEAAQVQQAGK